MRADFKSGFVTLIGRPNVGKSTLMNYLIGQKIAITSNKPQTTRNRIQTVLTREEGQIVFVDTPGIHKAKNKLGEYMVNVAERTLNEVDVVLWLVEPTTFVGAGEKHIAEQLGKVKTPVVLVINKVDMVKKEEILTFIDEKIQPQMDGYLQIGEDYYSDSDEVDNLSAEIMGQVEKTIPEIDQVTRLFGDVRKTSDDSVEKTTAIQESIEGCSSAMNDTAETATSLAELAQQLTDATVLFKIG